MSGINPTSGNNKATGKSYTGMASNPKEASDVSQKGENKGKLSAQMTQVAFMPMIDVNDIGSNGSLPPRFFGNPTSQAQGETETPKSKDGENKAGGGGGGMSISTGGKNMKAANDLANEINKQCGTNYRGKDISPKLLKKYEEGKMSAKDIGEELKENGGKKEEKKADEKKDAQPAQPVAAPSTPAAAPTTEAPAAPPAAKPDVTTPAS